MLYISIYLVIGLVIVISLIDIADTTHKQKIAILLIYLYVMLLWLPIILILGYLELRKTFL